MTMAKGYLPYDVDQRLLLPPDMRATTRVSSCRWRKRSSRMWAGWRRPHRPTPATSAPKPSSTLRSTGRTCSFLRVVRTTVPSSPKGPRTREQRPAERMRHKLASVPGKALYKMREAIVEPVFGQIKEARGLRRLLLRGFAAARAEFQFIAVTHNLLKLFRAGRGTALLTA
mgnify:FL=1